MESIVGFKALLKLILDVISVLILIRALLSWFIHTSHNQFYIMLVRVTEWILGPIRRVIPTFGNIDITPLIALLLIQLIEATLLM